MSRFTPPKTKRPRNLWAPLPSTKLMMTITTTMTRAASSKITTTSNPTMTSTYQTCKTWGLPCPFFTQSAPHPSPIEFDWSDEGLERNKQRGREAKRREQQEQEKNEKGAWPVIISPVAQCMIPYSNKTPSPTLVQRKSWP